MTKRKMEPDHPEPLRQCDNCGEDLYPGEEICLIGDMTLCTNDNCLLEVAKEEAVYDRLLSEEELAAWKENAEVEEALLNDE